ncbi:MAG: hypothetical protein ACYDBQ_01230 [Thermoplasmatota archaeon]
MTQTEREAFIRLTAELARIPFPERYERYRSVRPFPYEAPPLGHISNDENVALLLVMAQHYPLFGVKRMGCILKWPNIQIHHILQHGVAHGQVQRASKTMYKATHHAQPAACRPAQELGVTHEEDSPRAP